MMGASSPPIPASLPPPSSPLPPPVLASLPLPSSSLPPLPPSLFIPPVDRSEDIPKDELSPRKGLCSTAPTLRYERAEADGYGIRDTWVDPREAAEEVAPATLEGVNTRVTELAVVQEQDTQDIYADHRIDAQESLIATLVAQVSSLQGHLATALGEIRALQARDQTRADAPEGAGSSA
ncbi:hypothetical protein Tco_1397119 [Tanacetum coccineum]